MTPPALPVEKWMPRNRPMSERATSERHTAGPRYLTGGPFFGDRVCMRCGQFILESGGKVPLELDQRINEYHDFGGVPEDRSQGWFDFGPNCAAILRKRARTAITKARP